MPNIGNHVDAIFIPESVNTSTTLKINGGDLNVNNGQFFVDQSTTNVGIGTVTPETLLDIYGEGEDTTQISLRQWNDNSGNVGVDGPDIRFFASGGTIASPAEMDNDDVIGKVNAFAYNGTSSSQYGGFGWRYQTDGLGGRGSSFAIETKSINESTNSAKIYISEEGAVGIGTASPISVNLQVNGFYNSGTSEYGAPTQYFYTNLSSPSAGNNIGRIIFARNGDSATIAAKSTGTANETDLYFYNRTSGGADNVNNVQNTTPTLKLYHDKTAEFASDVSLPDDAKLRLGTPSGGILQIYTNGTNSFFKQVSGDLKYELADQFIVQKDSGDEPIAVFTADGSVELYHDNTKAFETTSTGIDVTGNDIKLLGPTSGSTFTTSTLTLRGYRQSAAGQFGNVNFSNIDANSANTEYVAAKISGQLGGGVNGGELKFFVTPDNSTTLSSTPVLILHEDSSGEFSSNLTIGGNLTVNGTTTTINSTTLTVDDKNIVLASGAANAAAADGAGITIDGANQTFIYESANDSFKVSTRLGIRTIPNINSNFRIGGNAGGEGNSTTYYGFLNNPIFQPDVTGSGYYNFVQVKTASNAGTAYTITNLDGYTATVGSGHPNADSTITNLTAFNVKNNWVGGTNNYGFRGQIPSGTNRWNVYMDGTAPNYFVGKVGIGVNNPSSLLTIKDGVGGESLLIEGAQGNDVVILGSVNGATNRGELILKEGTSGEERVKFTSEASAPSFILNNDFGIGTSSPDAKLHISTTGEAKLIVEGDNDNDAGEEGSSLELRTDAGAIRHQIQCGGISKDLEIVAGSSGTAVAGNDCEIAFHTKEAGSSSAEQVRIANNGNVGIGTNNPSEKLDVVGVAMASLLVDSVYASETWPAGNNTLAGNDLGTWTLTGGVLDTPTNGADDYHMVDTANLPDGLNAITWNGDNATSYLTSPNINISLLRTNTGIFGGIGGYSGNTDRTVADSRIYLTVFLAAQSMDTSAEYMEVELSSDGGTTWAPDIAFVSQDSDQDTDDITDTYWRKVVIDISEYSSSTFQIRFKGTGTGGGDGYGVSNLYIHEAPIPNRLQAKTLKLGNGTITNSTYEHSNALTLVASTGTSKLIVLEDAANPRQNYIGINNSDNFEIAVDEDNAGNDSQIRFRIDGKQRMKFYTSTDSNAEEAHLQLIGDPTPSDRSNWRITAQDDGTHGYLTISDFSTGAWTTNLTVHESGNVGIGTTDPANRLQIYNGNGNTTTTIDAVAGDAKLNLRNSGDGNWSGINFIRERSTGTNVVGGGIFMPSETSNDSATLYIQTQSASGGSGVTGDLTDDNGVRIKLVGGSGSNSHIAFETNNEALRIAASGVMTGDTLYLGGSEITSSVAKLQVNGLIRTGSIYIHEGGASPTTNNKELKNDAGVLKWDGSPVITSTGGEIDAQLIIDADDISDGALKISANQTNPENDFYFAQEIYSTLSGSTTTTADREQGGIYMDINSTATGGDTNHEHRAYGIYVDLDSSGDADAVYGVYGNATATPPSGTTSEIVGVYGHGEDNGGAGNVTNVYGVRGLAITDNATSDTNSLFGGHFKSQPVSDTAQIGAAYGVYAEIEIANNTGDHLDAAYVVRSVFDDNDAVAQTCNSYLFHGDYTGTNPTSSWGVYIADDICDNYFAGNLGIGIDTPTQKLHVAGNAYIGDGTDISPTSVGVGHITINANGYTPYITADATAMYIGHNSSSRHLRFQTNETTRMYINQSGSNVGIGTTHHDSYTLSIRNVTTPTTTGGVLIDCNDWSSNTSEYGINVDIDTTNRSNLTANRTHRGISADVGLRAAQNASNTSGTRQSAYGVYGRVIFNDTDNNDGKIYYAWGGVFTGRVDGVNAANIRGSYSLAQCGDNATGQARTVDNAYGAYNYTVNDGNQTTITNAYATYAHVNQDDTGGSMTNAYGVYSRVDRDAGTGGTGYAYRGVFEGTWSNKRGIWITGDTENQVAGSFSKGSGSFKIPHPLPEKSETHHLVHSFVESPQANNIYRGKVTLVNGSATINLDTESTMTEGTFVLLNRDIHCFTSNESDWDAVRGSVSGNILTIECQNPSSTATVAWLVIGERHDQHMYDTGWTDENGKVIVEPLQPEPEVEEEKPEIPD